MLLDGNFVQLARSTGASVALLQAVRRADPACTGVLAVCAATYTHLSAAPFTLVGAHKREFAHISPSTRRA